MEPEIYYRAKKGSTLVPILNQINPVHSYPIFLKFDLILSSHLRLGIPSGLFPSWFRSKNFYSFLFSPIRTALSISSSFTCQL
jgi:hypothetical protein